MNMLETHNNYMHNITIIIKNLEYQIQVLQVLLQMLKINTDNPMIVLMISRITINTNNFIIELKSYIDDLKTVVSATCLSDIEHLPISELKSLLTQEKENFHNIIDSQNMVNEKIIDLIRNKCLIDSILNEESLGL